MSVAIARRPDAQLAQGPDNAQGWANVVGVEWRKTIDGIVSTGSALIRAQEFLPHGEFGRMFAGHDNLLEQPVPFKAWTGQQLMRIANNAAIANTVCTPHLPASWMTLAYIARLPGPVIEAHIEDGTIKPDLKQGDAYKLYREWKESQPVVVSKKQPQKTEAVSSPITWVGPSYKDPPENPDPEEELFELIDSKMQGHDDDTDDELA